MGKIRAIRKYENPISFPETHKLWMDANHRPTVRDDGAAIWDRLHLIPFEIVIPKGVCVTTQGAKHVGRIYLGNTLIVFVIFHSIMRLEEAAHEILAL